MLDVCTTCANVNIAFIDEQDGVPAQGASEYFLEVFLDGIRAQAKLITLHLVENGLAALRVGFCRHGLAESGIASRHDNGSGRFAAHEVCSEGVRVAGEQPDQLLVRIGQDEARHQSGVVHVCPNFVWGHPHMTMRLQIEYVQPWVNWNVKDVGIILGTLLDAALESRNAEGCLFASELERWNVVHHFVL